jgi:hypothetical protein
LNVTLGSQRFRMVTRDYLENSDLAALTAAECPG